MPLPSVTASNNNYTINNSKALLASFALSIDDSTPASITINVPTAGLTLTLKPPPFAGTPDPAPFDLWPAPADPVIRGSYQISVTPEPQPGRVVLAVDIFNTSGALDETWELRAKATGPSTLNLDFVGQSNVTVHYLACDPRAQLLGTPAEAFEQEELTLHSADATDGTVIGTLPAALAPTYLWRHEATVAISALPSSPVQADRDFTFFLPSVYEPLTIPFVTDVAFGGSGPDNAAFLTSTSDPVDDAAGLKVSARPQQVVLVLDRSGSMDSDTPTRWSQAEAAARAFTHLFVGCRLGVHDEDRIGIVTFTDPGLWHGGDAHPQVKAILPMLPLLTAKDEIKKLDLEQPLFNTPIGDGVVAGIDLLGDPGPVGNKQFTLVLLTDGIENAGTFFVGPNDPNPSMGLPPGTVKPFNELSSTVAHPQRTEVLKAIRDRQRLFAVGLGSQIETDVLDKLAAGNGHFVQINTAADLAEVFADILTFSQDVNRLITSADATGAVHFSTSAGADRLVFVAMPANLIAASTIQLDRQDPADGLFKPHQVTVESTATHHAAWVADIPALSADVITWRVTCLDGATAVPLTADEVLAYEDLHVKADVLLDKQGYLTGDDMTLTVRLRHDAAPILHAHVRAQLEAPTVGLGTALSGLGPDFHVKNTGHIDELTPLGVMIGEVLRRNKWHHLPCEEPPKGLFVDGTDLLHDVDGDGNYTNSFVQVHKEGAFRWTLFAEGVDTKGHRFNRQLSISTLAGIRVDAEETDVKLEHIKSHPSGMRAVRVTVKPQDARGELLGPNKDRVVIWALEDGIYEHLWKEEPAPVRTDGTYQRVILFKTGRRPRLRVKASGTVLRRIRIQ